MTQAIRAEGLVKKYGDVTALDGIDLAVPEGTVLGLMQPPPTQFLLDNVLKPRSN